VVIGLFSEFSGSKPTAAAVWNTAPLRTIRLLRYYSPVAEPQRRAAPAIRAAEYQLVSPSPFKHAWDVLDERRRFRTSSYCELFEVGYLAQ
jgi:hypothetical protein